MRAMMCACLVLCSCTGLEDDRTLQDICLEAEACVPDVCGTYDRPAYEECMALDIDYCDQLYGVNVWNECAHECVAWTTGDLEGEVHDAAVWGRALGMYEQIGYWGGEPCDERYP